MADTGKVVLGSCFPVYGSWKDGSFWHARDMNLIIWSAFPKSPSLLHLPPSLKCLVKLQILDLRQTSRIFWETRHWCLTGNHSYILGPQQCPDLQLSMRLLQSSKGTDIAWPRTVSSWHSMEKSGRKQLVELELHSTSAGMEGRVCVPSFFKIQAGCSVLKYSGQGDSFSTIASREISEVLRLFRDDLIEKWSNEMLPEIDKE